MFGRYRTLRLWLCCFMAGVILFMNTVSPALAHSGGGVARVEEAMVGSAMVSVWTYPGILRPGALDIIVSVTEPETQRPIFDANVQAQATPLWGSLDPISDQAAISTDPADLFAYETSLPIVEEGPYQITVTITESDGTTGEVTFNLGIKTPVLFQAFVIGFGLVCLVSVGWLLREVAYSFNRAKGSTEVIG